MAIKQRVQSSHMPPCHRHMVIATNFSSMFDLLLCSTPQTRAADRSEAYVMEGGGGFSPEQVPGAPLQPSASATPSPQTALFQRLLRP